MLSLAIAAIATVFPPLVAPGSCISARAWGARWKGKKGPPTSLLSLLTKVSSLPGQISLVMDKFETQFEDLDVATGYYENATSSATAVATPQEDVDRLMGQIADENGLELAQELTAATPSRAKIGPTEQEEDVYVVLSSLALS